MLPGPYQNNQKGGGQKTPTRGEGREMAKGKVKVRHGEHWMTNPKNILNEHGWPVESSKQKLFYKGT